jgi:RNA polymerase sigma-70 factor (ECF subfamily)
VTGSAMAECLGAFEREYDYIVRTLRRFGASAADAEDLAQELFLVLWRRWPDYDGDRPLRPWLAGIAFRLVYNHRTRIVREVPGGLVDLQDDAGDPEASVAAARTRGLVLRLLATLPEKQRAVMVLHELDGLSIKQVAGLLNVPLFTVYSRLRAARLAFTAAVKQARLEDAAAMLAVERPVPALPAATKRRAMDRARALTPPPPPPAPLRAPLSMLAGALVVMVVALGATARPRPTEPPALLVAEGGNALRLAEGLVGYWRFDDGAGAGWARDLTGRGLDCQLRHLDPRGSWTSGVLGGAIRLDGNGWLECPSPALPVDGGLTIALWIKRASAPRVRALVTRQLGSGPEDTFHFGFRGDLLMIQSSVWRVNLNRPLRERDEWIHVATTHGPEHITRLFVDGHLVAAKQDRAGPTPVRGQDLNPLIVGGGLNHADPDGVGERFHGALDELLIYDRALGPDEIAALAARVQPRPRS